MALSTKREIEMRALTLREYAEKIGAELKPTVLEDMAVLKEDENLQPDNFFVGCDSIKTWLEVNDPSGGVNDSGRWPFVVTKSNDGKLMVISQSY